VSDSEFWIDNVGQNLLKGIDGDDSNPPRLDLGYILDFLRRIPDARESFNRLFPLLLPEEQERLAPVVQGARYLIPDYKVAEDDFQRQQNIAGIRTTGPHGGTRIGGNRDDNWERRR